ncbi:MAG: pilus assembly protein N-terminal domain-containing protein [Fimbriimonadales bacterium]|nr:pilus assembly protein N-terminal domain-containing protein [Fimbriimonadales bacterium]
MRRLHAGALLGLVLVALSFWGCSGGGGGGGTSTFTLAVTGNPPNATVYLNGQRVENPQRISLPPGTHRIRVEITLENGQVIAQEFVIEAGSVSSVQYELSRYRIETEPAAIEVVEGVDATVTATLRDLTANTTLEGQFSWASADPTIATVQQLDARSARVAGVRAGATKLRVSEARSNLNTEIPVVVRARLTEYSLEVRPNPVEVWVDEVITVTATLRHTGTGEVVPGDLSWRVANPTLAALEPVSADTVRIRGLRRGTTQLRVVDRRTGAFAEITLRVLDFPPPPD